MPSTYTLNNGIELIGTGEQSGTWGDTTNTNFELLDTALDGQVSVTLAATGSSGSPNTLPISDGASSNGRNRLVIFGDGGDLGGTAFVQLTPNDAEKIIYVRNNLSGSRSILLFQGTYSASNDYEVPAGTTAVVFFNGAGTGAVAANVFNNAFFDSLRLGNVSVTAILDEDDMSSDSATALATQQSIKAYVDTQITAEDLDFAGDSGTGAVDLDSQTFTIAGTTNEIETSASGQTLTVGLPDNVTISGDLTVDTDTLYVDSTNDRVGVNEATPLEALHVTTSDSGTTINKTVGSTSGPVFVLDNTDDTTNNLAAIQFASSGSSSTDVTATTGIYSINTGRGGTYSYGDLAFYTTNSGGTHTEAMRIDSSQRVLIGSTSSINGYYLQVAENSGYAGVSALRYTNDAFGAYLNLGKSRTTTIGGNTIVQDNDVVGYITFSPNDGTDLVSISSQIQGEIDGTPGANDVPGRLVFKTTADGAASSTERMRITSSGNVGIASGGDVGLDSTDIALQVGSGSLSNPTIQIRSSSSGTGQLWFGDNSGSDAGRYDGFIQYNQTDRFMYFGTAQSNALRIDSDQRTIIGGYSHTPIINAAVQASVVGGSADSGSGGLGIARFGGPPVVALASSPNTTVGSFTLTSDGTAMGYIYYGADDGTDIRTAGAYIAGVVDGTPGSNDMPGRLVFATTADGASSSTERMRINNAGTVIINPNLTSGYTPLIVKGARSSATTLLSLETDGTGQNNDTINLDFKMNSGADATERVAGRIGVLNVTTGAARGNMIFSVLEDAGNLIEAMRIDDDGFVGILNTNPQDELHIGAADATDHDAIIRLNSGGATGSRAGIAFHYEATATARARLSVNSSTLALEADINGQNVASFDGDGLKMAAGKGIKFDAYSSNNILNDYEEGTFDINIYGSSSGSTTYSQSANVMGQYTKIGQLVHVTIMVNNQTWPTFTGDIRVNLPFTQKSSNSASFENRSGDVYFYPLGSWDNVANFMGFVFRVGGGVSYGTLGLLQVDTDRQTTAGSTNTPVSGDAGVYFRTSIVYETDS